MQKDTSDNIYNLILDIKQDVGGVKSSIDNHGKTIDSMNNTIKRIESKQNEDMTRFINEKEKQYNEYNKRLTPLEEDFKKRSDFTSEVKKKSFDAVWEWVKLIVIFVAGYLLTIIKKL